MPEMPTEEFTIWLLNARRERWGLLLLLVSIGAGMFIMQEVQERHASEQYFWLAMGGWSIAFALAYWRFTKWASDPAAALVSAQGLTVYSDATGYSLAMSY